MRVFPAFGLAVLITTTAVAQDRPNTILVMDGSGSMWGQIDGVAKITIAQDVVTGLLDSLPGEDRLGLTVYGHRERGNCTDIETIVAPAEGTRDAIASAVQGIKPLGKTPMTDAIIVAAEALRYTEDSATVILVSDGVETCNPDPCAAARLLEEAGIDFTAHVIGFDVGGDAAATAQMQCIADETGGMFIPAADAGELAAALTTVVEDPAPVIADVTFQAVLGEISGPVITDPILWSVTNEAGDTLTDTQGNPVTASFVEDSYQVTAYHLIDETEMQADFNVINADPMIVTVVFPEPEVTASITAPASAPLGSTIDISWIGPGATGDYISIAPVDVNAGSAWRTRVSTADGAILPLLLPPREGLHVIAYFHGENRTRIGETQIMLTPVEITLNGPESIEVGRAFEVDWVGPNYAGDYIGVGQVDADGVKRWESFAYTSDGTPAALRAPSNAGDYLITYFIGQDRTAMHSVPISITETQATITAPATAQAGSTISVGWTGPDLPNDYIGIGQVGADGSQQWENFAYTAEGTPVDILVPTTVGDYKITYFIGQDRTKVTTVPISVTEVTTSITAPQTATAGSTIDVSWTGPDYDNDYIGVGQVGASGSQQWQGFFYTKDGPTGKLLIPTTPGDYLISYFVGQDRSIMATVPISVTEVTASITAPQTAIAGSTIDVSWTGPDYDNDYIGVGQVGASGSQQWQGFFYTKDGPTGKLLIPTTPGDYLISYFVGQDRSIMATVPISVTEVTASITAPQTAIAGSTIDVSWTGPDYDNDYIGVGQVGASGSQQWQGFFYTKDGATGKLLIPTTPGDYLISYFVGQDRSILKSERIEVTAIENVQLLAADTAPAGSELIIGWDGPDYENDYIGIGEVGATGSAQWAAFAYTKAGNPVTITLPDAPGDYLISYFLQQDRTTIATRPLTIE